MPLYGIKVELPENMSLGMKMHVKSNEIICAEWIIPVIQATPPGFPRGSIMGWFMVNAMNLESRFVHYNQVYSPLDGRPWDEVFKDRGEN